MRTVPARGRAHPDPVADRQLPRRRAVERPGPAGSASEDAAGPLLELLGA